MSCKDWIDQCGQLMRQANAVLFEELSLEATSIAAPVLFFPMREWYFPACGLHHRIYRLLHDGEEPPRILPGTTKRGFFSSLYCGVVPFGYRSLFMPNFQLGDRGLAKMGWGRLKEALQDPSLQQIVMPWSVRQVANLEATLMRQGWKVASTSKIAWLRMGDVGTHFCDYYGITH